VITGTGTPTITSTINIPSGGAVADVNIPNVKGRHTFISDIDLLLEGPSGDEIKLIGSFFCPTSDFNVGFDSESSQNLGCPPTGGAVVKPAQSLNAFVGQEAAGDWTLKVKVTDNVGEGGSLDDWTLEICSDVSLNPPVLVNNDTLGVQEGQGVSVISQFLRTDDADNSPEELRYTLVTAPTNGVLLRGTDTLELGDQFTQSDINFANLAYYDTDTTLDVDHFYFIVDDGQGGWVEITKFNIVVDPDAWIVSTDELEDLTGRVQLFPNPADEQVTLLLERPLPEAAQLELYSISGALLRSAELGRGLTQHRLSVADLAPGMYVLRMRSGSGVVTRRVVVR
jgi:subtilisin-like proprotein convertase family protein